MLFTVVWTPEVRDDFLNRWLDSDSETRIRLTLIANTLDRFLANDPTVVGKPLPDDPDEFICTVPDFAPKVSVIYEVKTDDRLVRITALYIYQ